MIKTTAGISTMFIACFFFQAHSQNSGQFESSGSFDHAVYGINTSATGINSGGAFQANSDIGRAVQGLANHTANINFGGWFKSRSVSGRGVLGISTNTSGTNYGGYFESASGSGRGAYGISTGLTGTNYGGYFQADGTTGRAVFGLAAGTTQENYGGWFKAKGVEGRGVYGEASDVNDINYGGYFLAKSIQGRAVFGLAEYVQGGENYGGWFKGKGTGNGTGVYAWGQKFDFYADGPGTDYGSSSSKRWKSNIRNINDPIQKLHALRGVYYDWDEEHGGQHDIGFIAEEVGEILPEIVDYEVNGIDAKGMDYSKLTPLLVEAVNAIRKEYQQRFDLQQAEINRQGERIAILEQLLQSSPSKEVKTD